MAFQGPKLTNTDLLHTYKLSFDHSSGIIELPVKIKTASYTVLLTDSGTVFTTYGATGAITFTLSAPIKKGVFYIFLNGVDQDMIITNGTADEMITFNDTQADGVAASTTSEQIGAMILVFCDGNAYYAAVINNGATQTVAT